MKKNVLLLAAALSMGSLLQAFAATAYYPVPSGFFFSGFSKTFATGNVKIVGPAAAITTWLNHSLSSTGATYKWSYVDPTGADAESTDKDLKTFNLYGLKNAPALTATDTTGDYSYQYAGQVQYGGNTGNYGFSNASPMKERKSPSIYMGPTLGNSYIFGSKNQYVDYWSSFLSAGVTSVAGWPIRSYSSWTRKAIGNYFSKPASPYKLSGLRVMGDANTVAAEDEFTITLVKATKVANDSLVFGDTIATATCMGSALIKNPSSSTEAMLPFTFKNAQGQDTTLTIDDSFIAIFSGFAEEGVSFGAYIENEANKDNECNAYVFFNGKNASTKVAEDLYFPAYVANMNGVTFYSSFYFILDANYPYLVNLSNEAETIDYTADKLGGKKTYVFGSSLAASDLKITKSPADWCNYTVTSDSVNGTINVEIATDTNLVAFRTDTITISGADVPTKTIIISQDYIAKPVAYYSIPTGFLYHGVSNAFTSLSDRSLVGPSNVDVTFLNTSTGYEPVYKWKYISPQFGGTEETNTDDYMTNFPHGTYSEYPTLTVMTVAGDTTYTMTGGTLTAGGDGIVNGVDYGLTNADITKGYDSPNIFMGSMFGHTYLFGSRNQIMDYWSSFMTGATQNGWTIKPYSSFTRSAIGNYFAAPGEGSYILKGVRVYGVLNSGDDATEYTITVLKANKLKSDSLEIGDTIATATCLGSDVIKNGTDAIFPFVFKNAEGNADSVIVNSGIIVKFSGFTADGTSFGAYIEKTANADKESNGYVFFNAKDKVTKVTEEMYIPSYVGNMNGVNFYGSFFFMLDAKYPWLETADHKSNTFDAAGAGESKTFSLTSSQPTAKWTVTKSAENGASTDWLTYTLEDVQAAPAMGTPILGTGTASITFTAAVNTGEARTVNVLAEIPGASSLFVINQAKNATGINAVLAATIRVNVVNGNFSISYPENVNSVKIYNAAGQLVKAAELNEGGHAIVAADNLANGLYILKFNNKMTVKVMK
ncbi:MAG: T9SS type A sorting domain-containing protein [Muribaculaceae bacterium]|jgi:hypothetical protein|nr:T9SS type A sorting domain-containing protein [Muribaculaceae bacterium]